jgi:hypothetical protein
VLLQYSSANGHHWLYSVFHEFNSTFSPEKSKARCFRVAIIGWCCLFTGGIEVAVIYGGICISVSFIKAPSHAQLGPSMTNAAVFSYIRLSIRPELHSLGEASPVVLEHWSNDLNSEGNAMV